MSTMRRRLLAGPMLLLAALGGLLLTARPAAAHPLDVYLQASYLTITPTGVDVEVDLSPGVLVAPAVLADLDADGDRTVSAAEAEAYARRVLASMTVKVDGRTLGVTLRSIDVSPYLTLRAGYGTVKVIARAPGAPSAVGAHEVLFRNGFTAPNAKYQVNAYVAAAPVTVGAQHRDAAQRQSTVDYRIGTGAAAAARTRHESSSPTATLTGYLQKATLSPLFVLGALGAALLLGALHALTPGHAKTLMAAYLVGSNAATRAAVTLGAVVTFTHTASVIVIGLLALLASRFLVPGVLVPGLEIASGLLVLVIGIRLLVHRWRAWRAPVTEPEHVHTHAHEPVLVGAAGPEHHAHSHGGHTHTHELPAGPVSARSLVAMGVSGGLVPCPEALGVMIVAVGVGRTALGLALIVAFSLGLAAVLIGFGVLLVHSRALVTRVTRLDSRWTATILPLISAGVVTLLGVVLVLKPLTG